MSSSDTQERPKSARTLLQAIVRLSFPHWKMLALATFSLFVGSSIGLLYPQAARVVIDDVVTSGKIYGYDLSTVGLGLLVLFAIQAVFVSLRYYLFTVVGDRVVADLRQSLYKAILSQEIAFFDERKTGELTSRLSSDTQIIQSAVTTNLSMLLRYGVQIIGGMGLLAYTSWRLSLVLLVVLPIVFVVALGYGRVVRKLSRQVQDAIAESTAVAEESIAGVRTVRSFSREAHETVRYNSAIDYAFGLARKRARFGAFFGGGMSFLSYGALAVVLWAGSSMVMDGTLTAGDLTAFLLYMIMVAFSLGVLSGLYTDFMKATGASERVFGLIEREPVRKRPTPIDALTTLDSGTLSFEGVTFRYPTRLDRVALDDVTFAVEPGRKVALVGHSGSGKSTIVSLISTFYEPDTGAILIGGHPLESYAPETLRESVGLVAQEPLLFSGTVEDNVLYGSPGASRDQVRAALRDAYALDFVEEFPEGLDTLIGERGVRLSGGQKQRIAIARAILKDPVILLLDEATSALDVESEAVVQRALDALMADRTTLIVAHRLSTIRSADHIVVLSKGRVMEQGTHEGLMDEQGHYARLISGQFE